MDYAIGIDVGTTNCKVALCDLSLCNIVHLEKFPTPNNRYDGYVDFNLNALKKKIIEALRRCRNGIDADRIRFISVASVGESGVLVYPDGSHLDSSIAWFDTRGKEYADSVYENNSALDYYQITGIPAHANYGLFKLLWLRDQRANLQDAVWLPLGDFVAWWFSGVMAQDDSLASRTFALDLLDRRPSKRVLEDFGIPVSMFPRLIGSGSIRGYVLPGIADLTGLSAHCGVCVAGHDHMVGSVACGLKCKGEILNSTGTSEGLLTIGEKPDLSVGSFEKRISNGRYVRPGLYSHYASLPTAGYSLEWAAKVLNIDSAQLFGSISEELYAQYLGGKFDGHELMFVPHLRGSGPPKRNLQALGGLYGIKDSSSVDDVLFSIYLGLAFEFKHLFTHMAGEEMGSILKVTGPATRSNIWMQLKADVLGMEVQACKVDEAVVRGAVLIAASEMGYNIPVEHDGVIYRCNQERADYYGRLYVEGYVPFYEAIAKLERGI